MRKLGSLLATAVAVVSMIGLAGGAAHAATASNVVPEVGIAAEGVLGHQYQVQETGYWCSAAAARIALSARGKSVSQADLARFMKVTSSVGLPNIKNLENALDNYTGSTYYQVKQWSSDAQLREKLAADVRYNVDRGHAVVINVIRVAGANFPGGHYATIVGYRNGGAQYAIADPASASRRLIWLGADDVASGIKLRRYVA